MPSGESVDEFPPFDEDDVEVELMYLDESLLRRAVADCAESVARVAGRVSLELVRSCVKRRGLDVSEKRVRRLIAEIGLGARRRLHW